MSPSAAWRPGNYVSPGQELMAIVPDRLWVTANFKETQLRLMRRGQHVSVTVDSCDKDIDGHVDSIQRGAGQAFGILPPENATGNFVKVVQRVPVKIVLDHVPAGLHPGPGHERRTQRHGALMPAAGGPWRLDPGALGRGQAQSLEHHRRHLHRHLHGGAGHLHRQCRAGPYRRQPVGQL